MRSDESLQLFSEGASAARSPWILPARITSRRASFDGSDSRHPRTGSDQVQLEFVSRFQAVSARRSEPITLDPYRAGTEIGAKVVVHLVGEVLAKQCKS